MLLKGAKVELTTVDIEIGSSSQKEKKNTNQLQEESLCLYKKTKDEKEPLGTLNKKGKQTTIANEPLKNQYTHNNKIKRGRIYENQRMELNVATHNINGLKANGQKIEQLQDWLTDNKIDVLGLAETNILGKKGFFLTKNIENYKSFWANAKAEKKKGSGVGLPISKH